MTRIIVCILLALFTSVARGQTTSIGDWEVGRTTGDTGFYAATMNDSGGVLGKYCLAEAGGCFWIINNKNNQCEAESSYPVMVNASNGAFATSLICRPLDGAARMVFADFALLENGIKGSEQIGLAFPMKNGQFSVSRFNIRRVETAISALGRLASTLVPSTPGHRNTRDQRL